MSAALDVVDLSLFDGVAEAFRDVAAVADELNAALLDFLEVLPTRSHALYAVINMPWDVDAWRYLRVAPTRRRVRRMREDHDDRQLIAWATDLARSA